MTQIEKLQEAVELIAEVQDSLDPEVHNCESCECVRYGNWDHKVAKDALQGASARVAKAIALLARKKD